MSAALRITTRPGDVESIVYRRAMRHQETVTVRVQVPGTVERVWMGVPVLVDLPDDCTGGRLEEWELALRG